MRFQFTFKINIREEERPELKQWIEEKKYMSPEIINELITLMGNEVLRSLLKEINAETWYSVIADEVTDVTNKEQFNISVRYVNDHYEIFEESLGFVEVPCIKSDILTAALKDVLIRCSLPLNKCRGQAYDGAMNMQGHRSGLGTQIQEEEPAAIKIHCLAHCINLCLQDVSRKCKVVRDALDLVFEIIKLIKFSPKRAHLFAEMQNLNSKPTSLKPLSQTRWTVRTASWHSVLTNYTTLMETMDTVSSTQHDEYGRRAAGQQALMEKFSTFYGLKLCHLIYSAAEQLSLTVQAKHTSIQDAVKAASLAKDFYVRLRNDAQFDEFYSAVVAEAEGKTEEPKLPRYSRPPTRFDDGANPTRYMTL